MAMSLDSHVVDRGSHPGPGGLKPTLGACVCPRSQEENGGEGIVAWPSPLAGVISHFLSLCLSLSVWRAHAPYSEKKILSKKTKKNENIGPSLVLSHNSQESHIPHD